MKKATTALFLSLALTGSAQAQGPVLIYEKGTVGFDFAQFPVGPYSGSFLSDGSVTDVASFPIGGSGASTAIRTQVGGVHYLVVFGGLRNGDGTGDVAFLFLRSAAPFAPGPYPVNPLNYSAIFGFVDDVSSIVVPQAPDQTNWQAWVTGLVADHKLLSASGVIQLTTVSDTHLEGNFSGVAAEFGGGIMVSFANGHFSLDPLPLAVESASWSSIKALYR